MKSPIQLGVSACLLGKTVRFDGGHKHDRYLTETLSLFFELIPVCPETAIGMGVPRQPIRLYGNSQAPRAIGVKTPEMDVSAQLRSYGRDFAHTHKQLSGFVVKKGSPSCGLERVKVYNPQQCPTANGQGLFTEQLLKHNPLLPIEEEGRLKDPLLRENFFERVFLYHRWQQLQAAGINSKQLVAFHSEHKYALMSRSQKGYRELGQLIATVGCHKANLTQLAERYIRQLMEEMKKPAQRKHHTNVLLHMMGYLKRQLSTDEKSELLQQINLYQKGIIPLIVPMTLLKHHLNRHPNAYLQRQHYLAPYPEALSLRNNV